MERVPAPRVTIPKKKRVTSLNKRWCSFKKFSPDTVTIPNAGRLNKFKEKGDLPSGEIAMGYFTKKNKRCKDFN